MNFEKLVNVSANACSLLVVMPNAMFIAGWGRPVPGGVVEGAGGTGSFSASGAFPAFVERHSRFVYRIALAVARNRQDAEDVVQETFLELYRGERWKEVEDERGYLARVAWRLAVRRRKPGRLEQELPLDVQSRAASPEDVAIDADLERWLHARIDALPEKLRQPLALAALGELKLVEIAKILGLPEGTVRRRIHTARQRLKLELAERRGQ
ncbi:MAG: sigma-70 family RNA polymerase sigma factor [Terracidiphilus sp.]